MAADGTSPLPGPDMAMKPGAGLSPFTALPFAPPPPVPPDQPLWEPSPQPPIPPVFSPGNPLLLSAFPSPLLVTGEGPGPGVAGTGQVIVKVKTDVGPAESSQTQNLIVTQAALNWIPSGAPCGSQEGPPPRYVTTSNVKTILPAVAVGVSQESPAGLPLQVLPPAAQLAPIVPLEKPWPGTQAATMEGGPVAARKPSQGDLAYASKGVYENYRRWQRYKVLARTHLSQSPDAEALSCFLIPVLRSLARLKPTMTLEEGLPRALQEWERTSNFDRMIFYEMAEKFMEFEAEEETQIQNAQLMNGSPGLSPVAPLKLDPPGSVVPEACQQPVYIPKKAASKTRAPRRRQRKPQRPPVPEAPKEIPPEAVQEYIDIMEGLMGSHVDTGKTEEEEEQQEDAGMYPDASLLGYIDELCSQEVFVSKVEAVIHPQFLADLLSPEEQRDPLALIEELEQEEGLTLAQLVQKRLLALEEEDAQTPPSCSGAQSDSSPSVSDEDEDGGQRCRPSPGLQGAAGIVRIGKSASPGKQAREVHGGQEQTLGGPRGIHKDGNSLLSPNSWDLQLELTASQGMPVPLGIERKGSGKAIKQLSATHDGHLGGSGSSGHYPVADRNPEVLPFCWQEDPQHTRASNFGVGLIEPVPLRGLGLEKPTLALQLGQQIGGVGMLTQGRQQPSVVSQKGSSRAMWGEDRGPDVVQSYSQNHAPGAAGNLDRVALSPGLWLSSDMDAVGLEFPLQIENVIDSIQDETCRRADQALSSRNSASPGPRKNTVSKDVGNSVIPCGGTDPTAIPEESNSCCLPGSLMANGPGLRSKGNQELSPEPIHNSSDLWAEACPPLLQTLDSSTLGSSKDTLIPTCQGNLIIFGAQGASSFPQASQKAENRGNLFFPLLENIEQVNILDIRNDSGPQRGVSKDSCSSKFDSHNLQGEGRENTVSSKPTDLVVPLQGNQESYIHETTKLTSGQSQRSASPRRGTRDAFILREIPIREKCTSADRAKGGKREEEDEELSNFSYLLASKLNLSSVGLPLTIHHASGGQGIVKASRHSAEVDDLGQPSPPPRSGKQALVVSPGTVVESAQQGAEFSGSGQKPLALGTAQLPQPRKRRRDSFVTSKRKKRRRSQ
ncbi:NUT family member 1 [Apodemus sylvaticus]|uniref:NUT family member 1 n=1 Tax=Apodemus sylvaticus TaxID=10129 RepID=UPI0022437193|nr:NUT family member 1 [Apodemus sylvaticus]